MASALGELLEKSPRKRACGVLTDESKTETEIKSKVQPQKNPELDNE